MNYLNKYTIFIGLILLIVIISFSYKFNINKSKNGSVIILNGPSASGKSSIQKEFQWLMMPNLWIKLGIDNLFDKSMPDITLENMQFWQTSNPIRWVEASKDKEQNNVITLFTGNKGEKVAYGMNSAIAEYAKQGCNIIVDYIAYKKEWIYDLQNKLKNIKTYWVKINVPLSILEEREIKRGTSPKGHARSHYNNVHWDIKYDLEIDSNNKSALEIAQEIKNIIKN